MALLSALFPALFRGLPIAFGPLVWPGCHFIPPSASAGVRDLGLVRLLSPQQVSAEEACDDQDSEYNELSHLLAPFPATID